MISWHSLNDKQIFQIPWSRNAAVALEQMNRDFWESFFACSFLEFFSLLDLMLLEFIAV